MAKQASVFVRYVSINVIALSDLIGATANMVVPIFNPGTSWLNEINFVRKVGMRVMCVCPPPGY